MLWLLHFGFNSFLSFMMKTEYLSFELGDKNNPAVVLSILLSLHHLCKVQVPTLPTT
jgi:hypothetical protein